MKKIDIRSFAKIGGSVVIIIACISFFVFKCQAEKAEWGVALTKESLVDGGREGQNWAVYEVNCTAANIAGLGYDESHSVNKVVRKYVFLARYGNESEIYLYHDVFGESESIAWDCGNGTCWLRIHTNNYLEAKAKFAIN